MRDESFNRSLPFLSSAISLFSGDQLVSLPFYFLCKISLEFYCFGHGKLELGSRHLPDTIRSYPDLGLMRQKPTFLGFLLFNLLVFSYADPVSTCSNASRLVGLESDFKMFQHQLRGRLKIIDDCSFNVSQFDMISGKDVHWWGAIAPDFDNLTAGFIVSDHKLNDTFKNASFVVRLRNNVTWDRINVLAVWDAPTASDFGHVLLGNLTNDTVAGAPELAPSPSNVNEYVKAKDLLDREPTMFDNCKALSDKYRVRWSLNMREDTIDVGLEGAIGITNYMAFGWANPNSTSDFMLRADVAIAGFKENLMPFVDDYYITKYSECTKEKDGSAHGVCPDVMYEQSDPSLNNNLGNLNNTMLVHGQRRDGVSFIRYRRKLKPLNQKYDHAIESTANMRVVWAVGSIKPPDSLQPYYLPQNHGGPKFVSYGHLLLNVSDKVNDCLGPLVTENGEDQDVVIADAKAPLVVTSGPAMLYPNPPNPLKVLYINKKESPVLRVERGVPIKFSIQAGHDVAFYITSDPLGGNATMRNTTETIYAGGQEAEGVQASPTELIWSPDRNTPDQVYYQSLYDQKMGWKVQVVDGGLPDMYNNSVILDDQQVTFFWTVSGDSISIAARGEKKSGYLAIGFGSGMVNSYAYVGWIDGNGVGRVNTYWIDGKDASSIHKTNENLTYVRCKNENGIITLEFTRPLNPSCSKTKKPECKNIIDLTTPLKVIWAMGSKWANEHLSERNMHSITSSRPIRVLLLRGSAEAEQDLHPVLAVHGIMMFLAWAILLPGGILAARYLKHVKGDGWYQIHVYLQYSGLAIILLALLFAVAELRGFYFSSLHVKFGMVATFFGFLQPMNAFLRPKKSVNGEPVSQGRLIWEYFHVIVGRSAIIVGIGALFTGMKHLGDRYGADNVHGLNWALLAWFLLLALIVIYLEYRKRQQKKEQTLGRSNWVLGNLEEDDSQNLLSSTGIVVDKESLPSETMEVQLEPRNR